MTGNPIKGVAAAGILAVAQAAFMAGTPAHATNGYFTNGYGNESKAMAGAGVAVDNGTME